MKQAKAFLIGGLTTLFGAVSAYAATSKAVDFVVGYDYMSILFGIGISVGASLCRTAYMLAVEDVVVINSKTEVIKDLVVASLGGLIATICIRAGMGVPAVKDLLTVDMSILLLFWAGWSRNAFFLWLASFSQKLAEAFQNKVIRKVENE